jgi:hypothetical protein
MCRIPKYRKRSARFSLPTGHLIPAKTLFKQVLPATKLATDVSTNKDLINLDEETAEILIGNTKEISKKRQ